MSLTRICGIALAALTGAAAAADSLQYQPAEIRLTPADPGTVMVVSNGSDEPIRVMVRAYRWDLDQGRPRLWATDELRVSPELQVIAPGAEAQVHIALKGKADGEDSFRLVVEQLPAAKGAAVAGFTVPVIVGTERGSDPVSAAIAR